LAYRCDVDGNDVGLAALVQEPDGQVARWPAPLLDAYRQVAVRVLARHPAHESKFSRYCSGQKKKQNDQRDSAAHAVQRTPCLSARHRARAPSTEGTSGAYYVPLVLDVHDAALPKPGGGRAGAGHGREHCAAQHQVGAVVRRAAREHHPRAGAAAELGVRAPHLVARAAADAAPVQRGARRGGEEGLGLGAVPARTGCTHNGTKTS
jgi:hypothetical protein